MAVELIIGNMTGTDINLNDGNNYHLAKGWAPKVAAPALSLLGGRPNFANVMEVIPIRVFDTSISNLRARLRTLAAALYECSLWVNGTRADPMYLIYNHTGSGADLQAPITGIGNNSDLLTLPVTFVPDLNVYEAYATLYIERRGLWVKTASVTSGTHSSQTTPYLFNGSITGGDAGGWHLPYPVKLEFTGFGGFPDDAIGDYPRGYVILSAESQNIKWIANGGTSPTLYAPGSGTFSSTAVSGAEGGNVWRLTPNSTGQYAAYADPLASADSGLWAFFANVENNSTSIGYWIYGSVHNYWMTPGTSPMITTYTPRYYLEPSSDPRLVFLGYASYPLAAGNAGAVAVNFEPTGTGGSSHTLDLDYFVAVAVNESTNILKFIDINSIETGVTPPTNHRFVIDANPLDRTPLVYHGFENSPGDFITYEGNAYFELSKTNAGYECFIGGNTGPLWGLRHGTSNATNTSVGLSVKAYSAQLIPE